MHEMTDKCRALPVRSEAVPVRCLLDQSGLAGLESVVPGCPEAEQTTEDQRQEGEEEGRLDESAVKGAAEVAGGAEDWANDALG